MPITFIFNILFILIFANLSGKNCAWATLVLLLSTSEVDNVSHLFTSCYIFFFFKLNVIGVFLIAGLIFYFFLFEAKYYPKRHALYFFSLRGGDRFQGFTCARQALSYQASWFFFRTKMEHLATGSGGQWLFSGAYKLDHLDFASVVKLYRDICGNGPCARPVGTRLHRQTQQYLGLCFMCSAWKLVLRPRNAEE